MAQVKGAGATKILGPVAGEYMINEKTYKEILTEMAKYDEIRSPYCQGVIDQAKETVMDQMLKKAESLGANAIIGLNLYHEVVDHGRAMFVAGKGTAARIEGIDE